MKRNIAVWIFFLIGCGAGIPEKKVQHNTTKPIETTTFDYSPLGQVAVTDMGEQSDGSFVACAKDEQTATHEAQLHFAALNIPMNSSVLVGHNEFIGCARVFPQK